MAGSANVQQISEITDKLEQGIKELYESERYTEYLRTMSKFYYYSFNNTLLIAMQKPDATLIAGYSSWQKNFQRQVSKGEKGIKILAPSPYKVMMEQEKVDPNTQSPILGSDGKPLTETVEKMYSSFRVVSVFDVSQTQGKELPDISVSELDGSVDNYAAFFDALKRDSPVPIAFEKIEGGAKGYYHPEEKRIAIRESMSEVQTVKTAIHEIAHSKLHAVIPEKSDATAKKDSRTREVEAESVAYTVCQHYGIETSDYSFGYIAGWGSGKETKELKGSLETIRQTAAEMIEGIDNRFKEIIAEQNKSDKALDVNPLFRLHSNPTTQGIEDRCFIQQYDRSPDGLIPGKVLYVGSPDRCQSLMDGLVSGRLTARNIAEAYTVDDPQIISITKTVVEVKSPIVKPRDTNDEIANSAFDKPRRLTPKEKEIKEAVLDNLKMQITRSNDGMLAQYQCSNKSQNTLYANKIKFEGDTVTQNGEPLFAIQHRYSSRKIQGCYRELIPNLEYIKQEHRQEKPSVRDKLKAPSKGIPSEKMPTKTKSKDMELG